MIDLIFNLLKQLMLFISSNYVIVGVIMFAGFVLIYKKLVN